MSWNKLKLAGLRFGRLIAIEEADAPPGIVKWKCRCDCGKFKVVRSVNLKSGHTLSCGCLARDVRRQRLSKYSIPSRSAEYARWASMIHRCHSPKSREYINYGARGIFVCEEWRNSFQAFLNDMGPRPTGSSIDRIDNDGPYSPSNCRWAKIGVQARNRRPKSKAGFMGVHQQGNKFVAMITHKRIRKQIGRFNTPEEAHAAYLKEAAKCL